VVGDRSARRNRALHATKRNVDNTQSHATVVDENCISRTQNLRQDGRSNLDVGRVDSLAADEDEIVARCEHSRFPEPAYSKLRALEVGNERKRPA
jgi:hypothetical protein